MRADQLQRGDIVEWDGKPHTVLALVKGRPTRADVMVRLRSGDRPLAQHDAPGPTDYAAVWAAHVEVHARNRSSVIVGQQGEHTILVAALRKIADGNAEGPGGHMVVWAKEALRDTGNEATSAPQVVV